MTGRTGMRIGMAAWGAGALLLAGLAVDRAVTGVVDGVSSAFEVDGGQGDEGGER